MTMWLLAILSLVGFSQAIWPLPVNQSMGTGVLWINKDVNISYTGPHVMSGQYARQKALTHFSRQSSNATNSTSDWTSRIVNTAINRTYTTLFENGISAWKFNPRMSDFEPAPNASGTVYITSIQLQQNASDPADIMKPVVGSVDESYTLSVSSAGEVLITGVSSLGLTHGLTTFTQLFFSHSAGSVYTKLAPVEISDKPMFPWRGLNIDCSRTFKPVSDLKLMIDALAYNKMNIAHLHITDSQSWPLVIPSMPDLADKGAYVSFQKYSPADIYELQEYGALRGVQVVLEIDQPGHTSSIWFSYPELISAFNIQPDWTVYCNEPPCGTLNLNDTNVSDFLEKLFDDLLPRLKPLSSYFHLGGDEIDASDYALDPTVRSNSTSVVASLLQKFQDRNQNQLKQYGFTSLVWEEQLLDWNLTLPKDTIVQTWLSSQSAKSVVEKGYRALVGAYELWYLDCGHGQWVDFHQGADSQKYWPYLDYCNPLHNWKEMYSLDPIQDIPENLQHLILGGECSIWSEQTDSANFFQMVWPRTCAAAEVLWSGAKDAQGQNRSQITASPRLADMRERLVGMGVYGAPIQMPFCTQNGTQCVWPLGA